MGLSQHTLDSVAIFPLFRVNLEAEAKDETSSQQHRLLKWIPAERGDVGGGKNTLFLGISVSEFVISGRSCNSFIPCPLTSPKAFAVACLYIPFWNPQREAMKQRCFLYSPWSLCMAELWHFAVPQEFSTCGVQLQAGEDGNPRGRGFQAGKWQQVLSISSSLQWPQLCPCEKSKTLFYDYRVLRVKQRWEKEQL